MLTICCHDNNDNICKQLIGVGGGSQEPIRLKHFSVNQSESSISFFKFNGFAVVQQLTVRTMDTPTIYMQGFKRAN